MYWITLYIVIIVIIACTVFRRRVRKKKYKLIGARQTTAATEMIRRELSCYMVRCDRRITRVGQTATSAYDINVYIAGI